MVKQYNKVENDGDNHVENLSHQYLIVYADHYSSNIITRIVRAYDFEEAYTMAKEYVLKTSTRYYIEIYSLRGNIHDSYHYVVEHGNNEHVLID